MKECGGERALTDGVGIYRLGDVDFSHFVRAAMTKWPANSADAFNPFDVSLWKVLQEVVSPLGDELATTENWKIFQRYGHCVVYTNFVWNLGGNAGKEAVARARRSEGVYLVHGGSGEHKGKAAAQELAERSSRGVAGS